MPSMPSRCLPNGVSITFSSGVAVSVTSLPARSTTRVRVLPGEVEITRCMSLKLSIGWPSIESTRSLLRMPALAAALDSITWSTRGAMIWRP